jgi:hypothetical protein
LPDVGGCRKALLPAAMLATLLPAGCGAARARRAPTRAQFIASADAVCRHEQAKLAYISARARRLGLALARPSVIRQQVAQSQLATSRLQSLGVPRGDARAIERWLTARTVAATLAIDVAEAPAKGERTAVSDVLRELAVTRARARGLALAYGSRVCGEAD